MDAAVAAAQQLLERFMVEASPHALVFSLFCRRCRHVFTVGRPHAHGVRDTGPPLTVWDLARHAAEHECAAKAAPRPAWLPASDAAP
jgi:hypothetical protein